MKPGLLESSFPALSSLGMDVVAHELVDDDETLFYTLIKGEQRFYVSYWGPPTEEEMDEAQVCIVENEKNLKCSAGSLDYVIDFINKNKQQ